MVYKEGTWRELLLDHSAGGGDIIYAGPVMAPAASPVCVPTLLALTGTFFSIMIIAHQQAASKDPHNQATIKFIRQILRKLPA
jgi:uncharacterized membrane protein